ncbi:1112_t:CDS:2, partial [Racocetra persica]
IFLKKISNEFSDVDTSEEYIDANQDNIQSTKKPSGRPYGAIWNFFTEVDCKKAKPEAKAAIRYMIESRNQKTLTNIAGQKRKISEDQRSLMDYFESQQLSQEKKEFIENALIKFFACCGIPWHLVEYPFFIELIQQLRPSYCPPNRYTLSNTLLDNEILCVINENFEIITNEAVKTIPVCKSCRLFFGLAQLDAAIKNISDSDHQIFYRYCIQKFNTRFQEFDFDEHLLAYYLHPGYRGVGIVQEILIAQLRDYHIKNPPYNISYTMNYDTPCTWLLVVNESGQYVDEFMESIVQDFEDIRQILTEADLYEDIEEITFEQVIANVDLDMIDNDDNSIAFEEDIILEETLNLSELQFLPKESKQNEIESNNDMSQDLDDNWLIDFEKEDDYDPVELATKFF